MFSLDIPFYRTRLCEELATGCRRQEGHRFGWPSRPSYVARRYWSTIDRDQVPTVDGVTPWIRMKYIPGVVIV